MAKTTYYVGTGGVAGDIGDADNWSNGLPATGDTAIFRRLASTITASSGLSDLAAVVLAKLVIEQSCLATIGTAAAYWQIGAQAVYIGEHDSPVGTPVGSGRIKLDLQNAGSLAPTRVYVLNSKLTAEDDNLPPVRLLLDDATAELYVRKGKVGVACEDDTETSTLSKIDVTYVTSRASDAAVQVGPGVTLATVNKDGGELLLGCGAATVVNNSGNLTAEGTGAIATLTVRGGTARPNNTGGITTRLNAHGGLTDFTRSRAARTVTEINADSGGQVALDPQVVTVSSWVLASRPLKAVFSAA